jgi:hypothetical protein
MKKLALIILLLGLPAFATDYTVTTSANQDTILERARLRSNAAICIAVGLPTSCTRAQAIAKDPVVGADYANAISNYVNKLVKANIQKEKAVSDAEDITTFEQAWAAASQAARDSACVTLGLPAGCKP